MKINKKAFTLMEMLVVMGIIGILVVFVVPTAASFLNTRSKKLYDTHKLTVEAVANVYLDQHKEQFISEDSKCYSIDYSLLLDENLKENDIHCVGNIIFRKTLNNNKTFDLEYYLKCTDSSGNVVHDDGNMPSGCLVFDNNN